MLQSPCRRHQGLWLLLVNTKQDGRVELPSLFRYSHRYIYNLWKINCSSKLTVQYLQASWRCRQAYSYHKKLRKASILTQSRRRGTITRRMYRKLTVCRNSFCLFAKALFFLNFFFFFNLNFWNETS